MNTERKPHDSLLVVRGDARSEETLQGAGPESPGESCGASDGRRGGDGCEAGCSAGQGSAAARTDEPDAQAATSVRTQRGRRLRLALLWLVGVAAAGTVAALSLYFIAPGWGRIAAPAEPEASCDATQAVHHTGDTDDEETSTPSDDDEAKTDDATVPKPATVDVPEQTRSRERGTVTVVDLGIEEASLLEALREQQQLAQHRGQTLLVMLTGRRCRPCRGVDGSIGDPEMQRALAGVRLVRADIEAFREDIDTLAMPRDIYPAFFLLARDLTPRDTIHGGEWGDDVAENIAPVLGAFVRGVYDERRYERAPTLRALRM